jgi:hypothetical protein
MLKKWGKEDGPVTWCGDPLSPENKPSMNISRLATARPSLRLTTSPWRVVYDQLFPAPAILSALAGDMGHTINEDRDDKEVNQAFRYLHFRGAVLLPLLQDWTE